MDVAALPYARLFDLLGGCVLVRCRHERCLQEISDYFSCSWTERKDSPDVVVECDWLRADRHLFRARPESQSGVLEGVRVLCVGRDLEAKPWRSFYPPLPPLCLSPFAGRFAGLHGAAIVDTEGVATLFVGERGSGKSTTARDYVNNAAFRLLTDETIFLHVRSLLVEPFPISLGLKKTADQHGKDLVPAISAVRAVSRTPALAKQVVILRPGSAERATIRVLDEQDAIRELLPHHLDVGADVGEGIATLVNLVRRSKVLLYEYQTYEELLRLREVLQMP